MAIINYENLPSENTPLTGGASGNLNVMQENGTSHGSDTKLGYAQSFLNDHIINVGVNSTDYRVNFIKGNNIFDDILESGWISGTNGTDGLNSDFVRGKNGVLVKANTEYTISLSDNVNQIGIMFYNGSTFISSSVSPDGTATKLFTFTTPANCTRFRVRFRSTDLNNIIMVNKGNTSMQYEPYVEKLMTLDGDDFLYQEAQNYSTGEKIIGTWIDGKPIYRKVVDFGALPNATSKSITHNISNLGYVVNMYGYANSSTTRLPINWYDGSNYISSFINSTSISIKTSNDRSSYNAYVIVEYTKTTETTQNRALSQNNNDGEIVSGQEE